MPLVRAYDGPPPSHPVTVVPDDPSRHGALVRVRGWEIAVADPVDHVASLPALAAAAQALGWDADRPAEGPPFTDGLVGFLTDDVAPRLLDLPAVDVRPGPAPLPALWFGDYAHAACQDPSGDWWLAGRSRRDLGRAAALLRDAASRSSGGSRHPPGPSPASPPAIRSTMDQATHAAAVRQIHGWIAAGDVYQVNLTLHVAAPWAGSPRRLARNLFGASHGAAHAAYLHTRGGTIISVSPETFLRTDGLDALVRPIKGTRRRSADPAQDRLLASQLVGATKDAAEHVMIVDLERNDLGRISEIGSVTVPQLMALEGHPTVWHLTSTVSGRLLPQVGFDTVIAALFPCGSITGAPKRMAVDRIRQLEPWRRGVYCGAVGVITRGLVDLSVAIRTAVLHDGMAWYGTGGGIVADSDPDSEWDEAMAKAAPFFSAVGSTNP
ncbi:MAG TPA: anthranilate synthase component I family protein [Euzebya sp.]|nr:anthranilate synthase component I family protein [Euzebya sp.]